jgi:gliding motility-associated-like protein
MDFIIFDRWGNKVFETENINQGWDGAYKGQPMNAGTYVYVLHAILNDGSLIEKKGNITLVR